MSGIYIKGMEMPSGCGNCPCSVYGACDAFSPKKPLPKKYRWSADERPKWCPAVEIKSYGRLISAELLKADFTGNFIEAYPIGLVHAMIDDAPTIIPAEEGE